MTEEYKMFDKHGWPITRENYEEIHEKFPGSVEDTYSAGKALMVVYKTDGVRVDVSYRFNETAVLICLDNPKRIKEIIEGRCNINLITQKGIKQDNLIQL